MKKLGMDMPGTSDVLFDYNPDTDGDNGDYDEYEDNTEDPEPEQIETKDGFSEELLLEYYTNHMRVLSSDHKPLDAVFSLKFDAVVPDLKAAIHSEVARELDRQENEGRPSIAVVVERAIGSSPPSDEKNVTDSSFDGVDFGDVKFAKSKRRNITIANTGRVPATFGFADRPIEEDQDSGPFPSWLSVTFDKEPDARSKAGPDDIQQRYTLAPAEVVNAELKLKLKDVGSVRNLNNETQSLDEVLVLRVENGRDHFLLARTLAAFRPGTYCRQTDQDPRRRDQEVAAPEPERERYGKMVGAARNIQADGGDRRPDRARARRVGHDQVVQGREGAMDGQCGMAVRQNKRLWFCSRGLGGPARG